MIKKLLTGLTAAMLIALSGVTVNAAGMTVSAGAAECSAGETVSVPITLSGNTGFSNLGIEIEYDDTVLTLTNVTAAQTGATYTAAQQITANPYNMGWDSTSNNTFNGTLATLEFKVAENAASDSYPITVSYYKGRNGSYEDGSDVNYDENFTPLGLAYENGTITVRGGEITPSGVYVEVGKVGGNAGKTVSIPVTLSGNTGFSNLGIEIGYDASVLTLKSATGNTSVGATYTAAQSITANPYNMGWDSTSNNSFNGTLATLEFEIADDAASGSYPITVSYYKGRNGGYEDGSDVNYDENFTPLGLSYVPGYVTLLGPVPPDKSISVYDIRNDGGVSFKVSLRSDEGITGVTIAALCDSKGRLISAKSFDAASEVDFSFTNVSDAATIKVFWWDSMSGMTPYTYSKTIKF